MAVEPQDPRDEEPARLPRKRARRDVAAQDNRDLVLPLSSDGNEEEQSELTLRDTWRVLFKRRWAVLGCTILVTAFMLIWALLQTPLYQSNATLQIESSGLRIFKTEGIEAIDTRGDFMGTQVELLKSRALAVRTARNLGLVSDVPFQKSLAEPNGFSRILALVGSRPDPVVLPVPKEPLEEREAKVVDSLMNGRSINVVRGSQLVRISFVSTDPKVAQRVADGFAKSFMEANVSRREENSQYAREFLEDRLAQLKLKLEDSERALINFAQQQRLASVDQNTSLATSNLQQLNNALGAATADRIKAESQWRQSQVPGAALSEALKSPVLDKLREARAELMAEYESKRSTYKPDYPEMLQLSRRISEVEERIKEEVGAYAQASQGEYKAALANENLLREQVAALQSELLDLQGRSVQFNILKRESDTNKQLYDALLARYKEIGVAGDSEASNVSMVDPALLGYRFHPDIPRRVMIGLLLGLMLGIGLSFMLEKLDETIKSPEDIERHLRLPVIGVVPKVDEDQLKLVEDDSRSSFSEAYRSLRTGLQYATEAGAPRVLLVTSAVAGEGKSTTAMMLARKFAQLGVRVLLIDADLRKPSIHRKLNLDNEVGLSNYLSGQVEGPAIFKPTVHENLTVVTSGATPPNPAELLAAARFGSLLTVAGHTYDQVIIDGPPLLGLADVPIIANAVDATLIAIEAGHARIGVLRGALKRLFAVRARIAGALLVKYDARMAGYGYGYGQGYGYSDYYYHYSEGTDPRRLKRS